MTDERALSETLGFLFVFALIVSMAAIVYATGFADLQHTRDFEHANNAERAFDVMGTNMEDIAQRGAPSRGTEVQLENAELYTADPAETNVTVADHDDPDSNDTISTSIEPIVYETEEHRVVYSSGAIFRATGDSENMVREPAFSISDDRVLMPMLRTYTSGGGEVSVGSQAVLVRALSGHSDGIPTVIHAPADADSYDVHLTMETERAELWADYFEEEGFDCSESDFDVDELDCTKEDIEHVQITNVRIQVVFE